jgi:hypothetical protein
VRLLGQIVTLVGVLACALMIVKAIQPGDDWPIRVIGGSIASCGIVIGGWALIWSSRD